MAVRPSPRRAPAVMIAPQSARMVFLSRLSAMGKTCSLAEHPHQTAADQQDAGQDDQQAAAAARRPRAVRAARPVAVKPVAASEKAAAAQPAHAHDVLLCP